MCFSPLEEYTILIIECFSQHLWLALYRYIVLSAGRCVWTFRGFSDAAAWYCFSDCCYCGWCCYGKCICFLLYCLLELRGLLWVLLLRVLSWLWELWLLGNVAENAVAICTLYNVQKVLVLYEYMLCRCWMFWCCVDADAACSGGAVWMQMLHVLVLCGYRCWMFWCCVDADSACSGAV